MPIPLRHISLLVLVIAASARCDTVTLRPAASDGPDYQIEGSITEYTGGEITIEQQGRPRSYPADRVVEVKTTWPPAYESGKQSLAQRAWAAAADQFTKANGEETRNWARRIILADLLRAWLAMGQWPRGGDLFIALAASDPQTPAWALAPLPWFASDEVTTRQAEAWLARREESARLLGAAWLLNTAKQSQAIAQIRSLARSPRPEIALLAETQLWRLDVARADSRQTDRWAARFEALPTVLRPGPQHLLAQALLRQKRYDDAALAALEGSFAGDAPHRLTARGLLLAAQALRAADRHDEAQTLLKEILRDYADTPQRQDAEALVGASQGR